MTHDPSVARTPIDSELLDRYLANEATPTERARIDAWLTENPTWRAALDAMRAVAVDGESAFVGNLEADVIRLRGTTGEGKEETCQTRARTKRLKQGVSGGTRTVQRWGLIIAAIGAAIIAIVMKFPVSFPAATKLGKTFSTPADRKAIVSLPDGSRLTLAPNTIVRAADFTSSARDVDIEQGEVFFEVARSANTPFMVRSGNAVLQVLGTSFLVRHPAAERTHVAVIDGKVRVASRLHANTSVTLSARQAGFIDSLVHVSIVGDAAPDTQWIQGRLLFHDTPVATILGTLGQWYGYHFRYTDPELGRRPINLMANLQSSSVTLAKLKQILSVDITTVGDTVILSRRPSVPGVRTPRVPPYELFTPNKEVGR